MEYDDLYRKLFGMPLVRRYSPGGILIEHLDLSTMRREAAPYFRRLRNADHSGSCETRARKTIAGARSRSVAHGLCASGTQTFREILLLSAERPRRLPVEGARRPGYFGAKNFYRWYKRRQGEEPMWDPGCPV